MIKSNLGLNTNKIYSLDDWKSEWKQISDKYEIIDGLGWGTYGDVVIATEIKTGRKVAIKKISNLFNDLQETKNILRRNFFIKNN